MSDEADAIEAQRGELLAGQGGADTRGPESLRKELLETLTRICRFSGGCSMQRLAEMLQCPEPVIKPVLERLVEEGLVGIKGCVDQDGSASYFIVDGQAKEEPGDGAGTNGHGRKRKCKYCGELRDPRGLHKHEASCAARIKKQPLKERFKEGPSENGMPTAVCLMPEGGAAEAPADQARIVALCGATQASKRGKRIHEGLCKKCKLLKAPPGGIAIDEAEKLPPEDEAEVRKALDQGYRHGREIARERKPDCMTVTRDYTLTEKELKEALGIAGKLVSVDFLEKERKVCLVTEKEASP